MRKVSRHLLLICGLWSLSAGAADLGAALPNFFYGIPALELHDFVLDRSCMAFNAPDWGLSCNPALLAGEDKRSIRLNVVADSEISALNQYRQQLANDEVIAVVDRILKEKDPLVSRAGAAVWGQWDWMAVSYVPLRMSYASLLRNSAYPELAVHVEKESELALRAGLFAADNENFQVGLQGRFVRREFIHEDFALLDVLADPDVLRVQTEKVILLDPAASYTWSSSEWKPRLTAMVSNIEVYQHGDGEADVKPVFDVAVGQSPPFAKGRLQTSTQFSSRPDLKFGQRWRWAALYNWQWFSLSFALSQGDIGAGFSTKLDSVILGVAYRTEEVAANQWSSSTWNSLLFQAGLMF